MTTIFQKLMTNTRPTLTWDQRLRSQQKDIADGLNDDRENSIEINNKIINKQ